jgi:hypothetical protein
MFSAPQLLTASETLLLAAAGAAVGIAVWRRLGRGTAPQLLGIVLISSTLALAPVTAWAIMSDIRAAKRLTDREAATLGVEERDVDTALVDRVAELIPPGESFALRIAEDVNPERATVLRLWALPALLPRLAVPEPRQADWIVTWGVDPRELAVPVGDVAVLHSRFPSDPPFYVGRVQE